MDKMLLRNFILDLLQSCMFTMLGVFLLGPVAVSAAESTTGLKSVVDEFEGAFPKSIQSNGRVREFELIAAESGWGLVPPYQAGTWSYNDQIPGPTLRIKLGETLQVRLINKLAEPTSIHWHGIRVPNAMDGVPSLTQASIKSGSEFTYRFTPKDAGTFWYHPHVRSAEQVERGLYGVVVVEDPGEPEYSREWVWILDDWLIDNNRTIVDTFVTRHDLAHDGRWGNYLTVNGQHRPGYSAKPGERIRIRMVNVANARVFAPEISTVRATVIAVDGMLTESAFPLDRFILAPGNRIDVDFIVPANSKGAVLDVVDRFSRKPEVLASVRVEPTEAIKTPHFDAPSAKHFPNWNQVLEMPVFHNFVLDAERGGHYGIVWTIDGQAWPERNVVTLKTNRFYRLRFSNLSSRLHPMHLHGQFFKLIARNGQSVDERFWRDTVLIEGNESVDIGLVPLDKGNWATHCHILEHAEAGMMSVLQVE